MKKLVIFPLSALLMFVLVGCLNTQDANNSNGNDTNDNNRATENAGVGESAQGNNVLNDNNTNNSGQSKVEVADDAAEKITAMEEVSAANVLVTNRNAYVGVALNEGATESEELKTKIADEVRKVRSDFNNVYVSFNPDVADRLTEYGNQIRAGDPVEGFFEEFMTGINRMFPEAK
ncbi:YhcN/YlaJ family sporulation lipoprotein [Sporosarcina sp. UB5]|uniref:YhcN/YlaJ family sporulation lipoprotein n=1 Tax=Sporosarcina sp. UB5 TaxID=3047463 RepID=UPI003D7B7EE5